MLTFFHSGFNCTSMRAEMPSVTESTFGHLEGGQEVKLFTLRNRHGLQAKVIEYGATITELLVPDRSGDMGNVVLGADSLDKYVAGFPAAAVIGRYANRIRGASFMLDGMEIRVTKNSGNNHIHGGRKNFSKVHWVGTPETKDDSAAVTLRYTSVDGEEGFPGNLQVSVTYRLSNDNTFAIEYRARTDKPTVVNLTNHAYFNLRGPTHDVLEHELQLMSERYTVSDRTLIPTGEFATVSGTPLDFREPRRIGDRIEQVYEAAGGYDHNFVVGGQPGTLRIAARVYEPKSGRTMECLTTEPGVQLYTANGFNGNPFPKHGGFCLETQHYPDSPNQPEFPSTIVRPNEKWESTTVFRFTTARN
jgi:aldose 1-epimerase